MIFADVDMQGFPTTLVGLIALTIGLVVQDWVKNRGKTAREDTKVSELSEQTKILRAIYESHQNDRFKSKKSYRRIKVIATQVGDLHSKHITNSGKNHKGKT